jgi:hypothetical protein
MKIIILIFGILSLLIFSVGKSNASDNICIFKDSQRDWHDVKIQKRDCQEYLKTKDCQASWQVDGMYEYAAKLLQVSKKNSMTPYKVAIKKTGVFVMSQLAGLRKRMSFVMLCLLKKLYCPMPHQIASN